MCILILKVERITCSYKKVEDKYQPSHKLRKTTSPILLQNHNSKLVFVNDTWTDLKPGDKGTVLKIDENQELIWVDWDNGEQLALLVGVDIFKIMKNR